MAGYSGVDFIDFAELEVYGDIAPSGTLTATPGTVATGDTTTLTASFTDPEGDAIPSYAWDFDGNGTVDQTTSTASTTFAYATAGTQHPIVTATDARGAKGTATTAVTVTVATRTPVVGKLPKSGRHGKVAVKVTCITRCKLTATMTMSRALERKLHLKSRTAGRLSRSLTTTSARKITLRVSQRVSRAARRRHVKTLKLTLSVTARTADGKRAHRSGTVRVRL